METKLNNLISFWFYYECVGHGKIERVFPGMVKSAELVKKTSKRKRLWRVKFHHTSLN